MAREGRPDELDRVVKCLAHRRRRQVLECLREHSTVTLADLADEVAVSEFDSRLDEIPAEAVKEIYFSLYHTHVPKLESADLVEYRQSADTVEAGAVLPQAVPLLDHIGEAVE